MNPMNHEDDSWDELLARLAHAEADLGAADAELQTASPAPLPPGFVDAAVAAARAAPRPRRRLRLFVVPAVLLLAAAAALGLLWPQAHDSSLTMAYPLAVELLLRPDQPPAHRQSAAGQVRERLHYGVETLQRLRDDARAPAALRAQARQHLALLEHALDAANAPLPRPPFTDLAPLGGAASDAQLALPDRLQALHGLAQQLVNGLAALHAASVDPELSEDCAIYLEQARAQLGR
jgi:hypothetical protein